MTNKRQGGQRMVHTKVKTAKGRKRSSTKWLQRQLNDPYVQLAQKEGYRSRAAYKLLEINDRFKLLKQGKTMIDLGATPGGWSQIAVKTLGKNKVIAVDLQDMEAIEGVHFIQGDFLEEDTQNAIVAALNNQKADLIVSDMAPASCGHPKTDHIRITALCETALDFSLDYLADDGTFLAKVFQGGSSDSLLKIMRQHFTSVKHMKPDASRKESAESYVIALGYKGKLEE